MHQQSKSKAKPEQRKHVLASLQDNHTEAAQLLARRKYLLQHSLRGWQRVRSTQLTCGPHRPVLTSNPKVEEVAKDL